MNYIKPMLLVPPELHAKLNKDNLTELDKDMHDILFGNESNDEIKWKLYSQCLHRYLHYVKEKNKPIGIEVQDGETIQPNRLENDSKTKYRPLFNLDQQNELFNNLNQDYDLNTAETLDEPSPTAATNVKEKRKRRAFQPYQHTWEKYKLK